jgi:dynein heavy chain
MLEKIIILKALRSDKVVKATQKYIEKKIGAKFVKPPVFNLGNCFKDSRSQNQQNPITYPLLFVLSAGSDPVADFKRFALEMVLSKF